MGFHWVLIDCSLLSREFVRGFVLVMSRCSYVMHIVMGWWFFKCRLKVPSGCLCVRIFEFDQHLFVIHWNSLHILKSILKNNWLLSQNLIFNIWFTIFICFSEAGFERELENADLWTTHPRDDTAEIYRSFAPCIVLCVFCFAVHLWEHWTPIWIHFTVFSNRLGCTEGSSRVCIHSAFVTVKNFYVLTLFLDIKIFPLYLQTVVIYCAIQVSGTIGRFDYFFANSSAGAWICGTSATSSINLCYYCCPFVEVRSWNWLFLPCELNRPF